MAEEVFNVDGVCSVRWDPQVEAIVVEWEADVGGDTYRECMDRVLDAVVDRDVTKLLADNRQQGLNSEADREWAVEDWGPRAVEAGLEYIAVVYPEDRSARTTVDMSARMRPQSDFQRIFTEDLSEARNWLRIE